MNMMNIAGVAHRPAFRGGYCIKLDDDKAGVAKIIEAEMNNAPRTSSLIEAYRTKTNECGDCVMVTTRGSQFGGEDTALFDDTFVKLIDKFDSSSPKGKAINDILVQYQNAFRDYCITNGMIG